MTDARWKRFYDQMTATPACSRPASTSRRPTSLRFVNKGVVQGLT
jgi:hypothetical protein